MLFTIEFEYRGGSYFDQIRARTPRQALHRWARRLDPKGIAHFGPSSKAELLREIARPIVEIGPIRGLIGCWRFVGLVRGETAYVNIVATASVAAKPRASRRSW